MPSYTQKQTTPIGILRVPAVVYCGNQWPQHDARETPHGYNCWRLLSPPMLVVILMLFRQLT